MKKTALILMAIMVTLTTDAQKILDGAIPSLKGEGKINLKIDFSETKIDNKSIADWLEYRQATQPKYDAQKELEEELKPVVQEKILKILNNKLSKKGDNTNECYILDEDGNALVKFQIPGSGGHWGSMSNLWGDGYEDAAKSLASFILKCFK